MEIFDKTVSYFARPGSGYIFRSHSAFHHNHSGCYTQGQHSHRSDLDLNRPSLSVHIPDFYQDSNSVESQMATPMELESNSIEHTSPSFIPRMITRVATTFANKAAEPIPPPGQ